MDNRSPKNRSKKSEVKKIRNDNFNSTANQRVSVQNSGSDRISSGSSLVSRHHHFSPFKNFNGASNTKREKMDNNKQSLDLDIGKEAANASSSKAFPQLHHSHDEIDFKSHSKSNIRKKHMNRFNRETFHQFGFNNDISDDDTSGNSLDDGVDSDAPTRMRRRHSMPTFDNLDDLIISNEMSLKDRQNAINQSHPFGMRLWKPALYKKSRTIEKVSYQAVHESPSSNEYFISIENALWAILFGWWMCLIYIVISGLLFVFSGWTSNGRKYARLCFMLSGYLLWPFGRFIERVRDGNSWEANPLLPSHGGEAFVNINGYSDPDSDESDDESNQDKPTVPLKIRVKRLFRGMHAKIQEMHYSDFLYSFFLYTILMPLHLAVSAICWMLVITIPMAKLNWQLSGFIRSIPKELSICPLFGSSRLPSGEIVLCAYRSVGLQYYKYTYDGVNIIFINLMAVVILSLLDGYFLAPLLNHSGIGNPVVIFGLSVISVIPLAYFIGMAVASISSQSSFGMGAVINASFGSIVEIILYWLAIRDGKGLLVEGAIVGSFLGTLLLLPGVSMIAGGVGKWKEQRFNVKSAGVSTVLLIMALIGAFTPTLFYSIYGSHELQCKSCEHPVDDGMTATDIMARCRGCFYKLPHNPGKDPLYVDHTKPLMYFCAAVLPTAYLIGLWFTLRTHVKQIYHTDHKKHESTLLGLAPAAKNGENGPGELAGSQEKEKHSDGGGGHDAPEWSKMKSALILLVSTILFALLAEKLVDTVDEVISNSGVSEKFLGLTLFAIVPSFTEFMNAVAFASYGNIALSLEIGSAYAVQIALIQIPILVGFSGLWNSIYDVPDVIEKSFTLIFPKWDCYTVFFSVFLLSYTYIEGKSNYFKGSILTLAYLVMISSFYFAPE